MTTDVHHGLAVDRLTSSSSLNSSVFSGECNGTPVTRVVSIVVFLVLEGQSGAGLRDKAPIRATIMV